MTNIFERGPKRALKDMVRNMLPLPRWLCRTGHYGLALLFVAMAAMLRWALPEVLGPTPFLAFYLAWVGAAAFGGLGPGLLATAASWVCIDLLFDPTDSLINFSDPTTIGRLVVLVAGGLTVSLVAERMRRGRTRERRQAQELGRLAQLLEREKGILQSVMNGAKNSHLVYLDRDFNFVHVNEAYARTCGYTPEEMIGKNHFALYPHAENEAIFARVRDTGVPVEVHDKPFVFPDQPERGTTYWDWTLTPVKDDAGHVEGLVLSLFETTQRKRAEEAMQEANERLQQQSEELQAQAEELATANEELRDHEQALRESEERYHHLFEDDLTGDFISTPGGQVLLCNPAFARIFGFSRVEEAAGTNMLELYVDPSERETLLDTLRQQGKIERLEVWRKRCDGKPIYVVENLVGRFDDQGRLSEIKGYIFDDTDRKRAEEALRELNATLESKVAQRTAELEHRARQLQKLTLELSQAEDQERRRLAEILHDDLQQILAAAKFHLGLLSRRVKHDPPQYAVAIQIDHMLKDAIEKSRSLSHELSPAVLHHGDFAETLGWLANQVQTKHGLLVHVDAFGQVIAQSDALKAFLYKAAQEMLFNVVKHARVNEARIRIRRLGRYLCLSVSDHGRGLDPEQLRQTSGFGLLSIRERVELLGGRMKIKSAKSKGSTFFLVVPDGQPQPTESRGQKTVGAGPRARPVPDAQGQPPLRVLLADDHAIVREGLISLLSEEGTIQVIGEAANGREAVDLASRLEPDVVIMDVSMPLINGDEATRQIKQHLPRTRVVALSMFEEPETIERMRAAGAEAYVLKTAPSEELLAAIRGLHADTAT